MGLKCISMQKLTDRTVASQNLVTFFAYQWPYNVEIYRLAKFDQINHLLQEL